MHFIIASASVAVLLLAGASASAQTPAGQKPTNQPPAAQQPASEKDRTLGKVLSDSWITMKIHSLFVPDDALEGSDIDVETRSGVVTLTGTVANEAGRKRAVEIARTTDGVKSVNDAALKIGPASVGTTGQTAKQAGRTVNDGWIKSKIYAQFLTEDALNDSNIDVDVAKGMVTLSGSARTQAGVTRAEAIAKGTDGVKGVKNNIKVGAK